jgi:hypothetical protein
MTFPVPFFLEQPVPFHIARVAVSISPPVITVLFYPALLGPLLVVTVIRIVFQLSALPPSFAETPAFFSVAVLLVFGSGIGKKKPATVRIGTSDLLAHGSSLREKTMTLRKAFQQGKNKNKMGRK